jgi:hypothetical protein
MVDCRLTVAGADWYRLDPSHMCLPADALHPVAGTTAPDIPSCS